MDKDVIIVFDIHFNDDAKSNTLTLAKTQMHRGNILRLVELLGVDGAISFMQHEISNCVHSVFNPEPDGKIYNKHLLARKILNSQSNEI